MKLRPSDFSTAMIHFYRGEVSRSNTWRTRLDNTTNWSVITTAAVLTFAYGAPDHSHVVILISMALIWLFLVIEARRYRYYELCALRIRLMETDFFATMLSPPHKPHHEWAPRLVETLLAPEYPISFWEALGRRLRRNYIWLFLVLGGAWVIKLWLFPSVSPTLKTFYGHAAVGFIPGTVVMTAVAAFFVILLIIGVLTMGLRASPGEVLSRGEVLGVTSGLVKSIAKAAKEVPFLGRSEQLTIVITSKPKEVGEKLLTVLRRGVTALQGTGMYSGEARSVLFCAVRLSEIARLKAVVYAADNDAFIVVNPTEEIWGKGFRDLQPKWKRFFGKEPDSERG